MLTVQISPPESVLSPFIRAYVQREARLGAQELVEPVVARLGVMLEFEFAGPYEIRNYGSNALDDTFPISIIGPQTWRRVKLIIRDHVESLVVMFQPAGFHALFGVPTAALAETGTEGRSVLGPPVSRLHEQLSNVPTFQERCQLLDRYFLSQPSDLGSMDPIYGALRLLTTPGVTIGVEQVARQAGVNRKYLERRALTYSGVSPNALRRISRFSRALLLRQQTTQTWTQIAHATGYHDQMHMIRDFRVFAGEAPVSALQEITPDHLINFALTDAPHVT